MSASPNNLGIITYDEKYVADFIALNRQWIEKHFVLEPMDLAQLENPRESILKDGGEIFFLMKGEKVVGTCAMVPHGPNEFELAKMAVSIAERGAGYGDLLMKGAIEWARSKRATKVILLSNTVLKPAISLYHKHGFKTVHLGAHPHYDRCNITMELQL